MTVLLGSYHGDDNCYSLTSTQQFPAIFGQSKVDDQIQRVENDSKKRYYRNQGKQPGCTEILNAACASDHPLPFAMVRLSRLVWSLQSLHIPVIRGMENLHLLIQGSLIDCDEQTVHP